MLLVDLITDWEWVWEQPKPFGWFHILSFVIMILVCIVVVHFLARRHDKKTDNIFIFCIGTTLVILEIYKQFFYYLVKGYYDWDFFPLQLCSLPIYFSFIGPLIKNEKIQNFIYKFLASFSLLAGLCIMVYPATCLDNRYITMLLHTMIWHSSMFVMGVYLIVSRGYGKKFKELLSPVCLFIIITITISMLNYFSYNQFFGDPNKNIHGDECNLFYISPYFESPLPIAEKFKEIFGFPIFFISYILIFCFGAFLVWTVVKGIRKIGEKFSN